MFVPYNLHFKMLFKKHLVWCHHFLSCRTIGLFLSFLWHSSRSTSW